MDSEGVPCRPLSGASAPSLLGVEGGSKPGTYLRVAAARGAESLAPQITAVLLPSLLRGSAGHREYTLLAHPPRSSPDAWRERRPAYRLPASDVRFWRSA